MTTFQKGNSEKDIKTILTELKSLMFLGLTLVIPNDKLSSEPMQNKQSFVSVEILTVYPPVPSISQSALDLTFPFLHRSFLSYYLMCNGDRFPTINIKFIVP